VPGFVDIHALFNCFNVWENDGGKILGFLNGYAEKVTVAWKDKEGECDKT
jgi:hypothetical protein